MDIQFFFDDVSGISVRRLEYADLKNRISKMRKGNFRYFYGGYLKVPDWTTNPITGYEYPKNTHWTMIPTFNSRHGDIKYVWEKSRFCYLYDIIRFDYHFQEDQSKWVFSDILEWMNANPINTGPNHTCSQEISIRCFNWLFALHYYKNSSNLDNETFNQIMHFIFWQLKHVRSNMQFSRIAVRNNHTLTEALALYIFGTLFPGFEGAQEWKDKGKKWFEEEVEYQIFNDGTFIQYSMNYNRVVVQLLTWFILISKKNNEDLKPIVIRNAEKTLTFLLSNIDPVSGHLPNYGANDGALFFKLSESDFRDFRPQLNALSFALNDKAIFTDIDSIEELGWYGLDPESQPALFQPKPGISQFKDSGYYLIREVNSFTMIRCGNHKNRPSQADNLHVDLWFNGVNIMRDAGSYRYNTEDKWRNFFNGTIAHNSLSVNDLDQMERGPHFIYLKWSQSKGIDIQEHDNKFVFSGKIRAFEHSGLNIIHNRKLVKYKNKPHWIIEDLIDSPQPISLKQVWNPSNNFEQDFSIMAWDDQGSLIKKTLNASWYSSTYGVKEKSIQFQFNHNGNYIRTEIMKRDRSK